MTHIQTTRRAFMGHLGLGIGMGALVASRLPGLWSLDAAEATAVPPRPVVSIFMDLPWVDMTGRAEPYVPPCRAVGEDFSNYPYYMV